MEHLWPSVRKHLGTVRHYDFLWRDNMKLNFSEFMEGKPGESALSIEVDRLLRLENQVSPIPENIGMKFI